MQEVHHAPLAMKQGLIRSRIRVSSNLCMGLECSALTRRVAVHDWQGELGQLDQHLNVNANNDKLSV